MKHVSKLILCSMLSILLTGCGAAEFSGSNANSKASADDANGTLGQNGTDDSNGNLGQDDGDDANGNLPQMTVDELLGLIAQDPAQQAVVEESDLRCYISHSGGHGIEMCAVDPTPLLPLSVRGLDPRVEVKGNEICAKIVSITTNAALFKAAGATTGPCK